VRSQKQLESAFCGDVEKKEWWRSRRRKSTSDSAKLPNATFVEEMKRNARRRLCYEFGVVI
jgi:hypothetical protein